jgi:hypothetical protein
MDGFTWYDKLVMRAGLVAIVAIGAAGIYLQSPAAAAAYLVFGAAGGLLVVYDLVCVYCPYPFQHSDCLFYPHPLVSRVTELRTGPIPLWRKGLTALVFGGLVALPQYWLWGNWALLAAFWAVAVPLGVLTPIRFCRRCRHHRCPLNMAPRSGERGTGALSARNGP